MKPIQQVRPPRPSAPFFYLKASNERPDQPKNKVSVAGLNVFACDVDETNVLLLCEELQRGGDVRNLLNVKRRLRVDPRR